VVQREIKYWCRICQAYILDRREHLERVHKLLAFSDEEPDIFETREVGVPA
jgi:hypothetical protein